MVPDAVPADDNDAAALRLLAALRVRKQGLAVGLGSTPSSPNDTAAPPPEGAAPPPEGARSAERSGQERLPAGLLQQAQAVVVVVVVVEVVVVVVEVVVDIKIKI